MRPSPLRLLPAAALLLAAVGSLAPAAAAPPAAERRVVRGSDGYLFIAQDWSVPCQHAGEAAATASRMAGLVAAVQRSGRDTTVVSGRTRRPCAPATSRARCRPRSAG